MPNPNPSSVLAPLLALALALLAPAAALAEVEVLHGSTTRTVSCGEEVLVVINVGSDPPDATHLTGLRLEVPFPDHVTLVHDSLVWGGDASSRCSFTGGEAPGDTRIAWECSFLCSNGIDCDSNGATLTARVRIDDPNPYTRFQFQAALTANEVTGVLLGDDTASLEPGPTPTTVTYAPCPATVPPPQLVAHLADALGVDGDGDGRVDEGDTILYTATVRNLGGSFAQEVRLDVPEPEHGRLRVGSVAGGTVLSGNAPGDRVVSVDLGSLAPEAFAVTTWQVRVEPVPPSVDRLSSQGLASAANADSRPSDDPATPTQLDPTETPLDFDPDLGVAKRAVPERASPGEILAWELDFTHRGRAPAPAARLVETVPEHTTFDAAASSPGWSCADASPAGTPCELALGNLAPGTGGSRTFAVRVVAALPAGVQHTENEVLITDAGTEGPDPNPDDNRAQASAALEAAPDLWVSKSGPAEAAAGQRVTYRVAWGNAGDQAATGVRVVETVPDFTTFEGSASSPGWSCDGDGPGAACVATVGSLPAGASGSLDFAVRVDDRLPVDARETVNRVSVDDDGTNGSDPAPVDNGDRVTTRLVAAPDLAVTKAGPAETGEGTFLDYTLTVAHRGDRHAGGVVLVETPPSLATVDLAGSDPGWTCTGIPVECRLELGDLPAGATRGPLAFRVRLPDRVPREVDRVVNLATVGHDGRAGADRDPGNDSARVVTRIVRLSEPPPEGQPALAALLADHLPEDRDGDGAARTGETVAYTLLLRNTGTAEATGVSLALPLDPRSRYRDGSATTTGGKLTTVRADGAAGGGEAGGGDGDRLLLDVVELPPGDSVTVTWEVVVEAPLPPSPPPLAVQGEMTADRLPPGRTDDPDTPAPLDPTHTPLAADDPLPVPQDVPTLSQAGLFLLVGTLLALAFRRLGAGP